MRLESYKTCALGYQIGLLWCESFVLFSTDTHMNSAAFCPGRKFCLILVRIPRTHSLALRSLSLSLRSVRSFFPYLIHSLLPDKLFMQVRTLFSSLTVAKFTFSRKDLQVLSGIRKFLSLVHPESKIKMTKLLNKKYTQLNLKCKGSITSPQSQFSTAQLPHCEDCRVKDFLSSGTVSDTDPNSQH